MLNLILVDQADGFLLGVAVMALISVLLWPVRFCVAGLRARVLRAGR